MAQMEISGTQRQQHESRHGQWRWSEMKPWHYQQTFWSTRSEQSANQSQSQAWMGSKRRQVGLKDKLCQRPNHGAWPRHQREAKANQAAAEQRCDNNRNLDWNNESTTGKAWKKGTKRTRYDAEWRSFNPASNRRVRKLQESNRAKTRQANQAIETIQTARRDQTHD